MRLAKTRPMAKFKRIITVGALLAVSWMATGAMNNAYADWSAVTKTNTWFYCKVDCQAGGFGPVRHGVIVAPGSQIGAWERTVWIKCRMTEDIGVNGEAGEYYYVTVKDKNWTGWWLIDKTNLTRAIDESTIPAC